jgi:hypothetical protein
LFFRKRRVIIRPKRGKKPCGAKEGITMIKKREVATVLALLGAVCALCLREMKKAGERLEKDLPPRPPVNQTPEPEEEPRFMEDEPGPAGEPESEEPEEEQ